MHAWHYNKCPCCRAASAASVRNTGTQPQSHLVSCAGLPLLRCAAMLTCLLPLLQAGKVHSMQSAQLQV